MTLHTQLFQRSEGFKHYEYSGFSDGCFRSTKIVPRAPKHSQTLRIQWFERLRAFRSIILVHSAFVSSQPEASERRNHYLRSAKRSPDVRTTCFDDRNRIRDVSKNASRDSSKSNKYSFRRGKTDSQSVDASTPNKVLPASSSTCFDENSTSIAAELSDTTNI